MFNKDEALNRIKEIRENLDPTCHETNCKTCLMMNRGVCLFIRLNELETWIKEFRE